MKTTKNDSIAEILKEFDRDFPTGNSADFDVPPTADEIRAFIRKVLHKNLHKNEFDPTFFMCKLCQHVEVLDRQAIERLCGEAIHQAIAQERERIVKDVRKMKWKNTPKTMLTSYHNGSIGYHKGDGVHIPHTIGSSEDMGHSHYNEAIEDVINIITNNHE